LGFDYGDGKRGAGDYSGGCMRLEYTIKSDPSDPAGLKFQIDNIYITTYITISKT
jgi:hypothetical protein